MARNSNGGKKRLYLTGLHARSFPRSVREYLDADYIDKLSPGDQQWLAKFNETHYGADFRNDPFNTPAEKRRETYRQKNAANRDAYAFAQAGGRLVPEDNVAEDELTSGRDLQPTQSYLDDGEYKAALAAYRELLPQVANKPNRFSTVKKLAAARKRLELAKQRPHAPKP